MNYGVARTVTQLDLNNLQVSINVTWDRVESSQTKIVQPHDRHHREAVMRRRNPGFSILELVIAFAIVMLVLAAATTFFISTVRQYKVQTKIIETNVEGILGLELLRQDLESLGFGLPWDNVAVLQRGQRCGSGMLNDAPNVPPRRPWSVSTTTSFSRGSR